MIVSLDEIKEYLRYDDTPDNDAVLMVFYNSAMTAILNYVTDTFTSEDEYPEVFKLAVLSYIGWLDSSRDGSGIQKMEMGADTAYIDGNYIPAVVRNVLYPYRTPTVV